MNEVHSNRPFLNHRSGFLGALAPFDEQHSDLTKIDIPVDLSPAQAPSAPPVEQEVPAKEPLGQNQSTGPSEKVTEIMGGQHNGNIARSS
jgi:hypothetical protein